MPRPIMLARLDKVRPVLVLTREHVREYLTDWTVAPITSRTRGLPTELPVGPANGLDHASMVALDRIETLPRDLIGELVGHLHRDQEPALAAAIIAAFDLVR
ncbi:MAG: type II toxin-antitoxin system PemK/MazF family toxin [Candidatus Dormibacteraceae bacterium]